MTSTQTQQTRSVNGPGDIGVHLLLSDKGVKLTVEDPEQVIEEIRMRATKVGSILEGILLEPHGQSDWGLND
jgi:hypothetical protein